MKKLILPLTICLLTSIAFAQRSRRKPASKGPAPAATPAPAAAPTTKQPPARPKTSFRPIPIVVLNGQTITSAQFEPQLREQIEAVDEDIAEIKQNLLERQINTLLLQAEAQRRGITTERLYALEVGRKLTQPTAAEIKKFAEDNREELEGLDATSAASQIATYILSEREEIVSEQLVQGLKKLHRVLPGLDINTPNLPEDAVVATVAGQTVKAGAIRERLKPIEYRMRLQAYLLARRRAESLLTDLLLLAEADKRQIGPEQIIRTEVTEKARRPTDAEVKKFYEENKNRVQLDFEQARFQIGSYLEEQEKLRLENELGTRLRQGADIRWLISEPDQPVQSISTDDDPARGDVNAPVTIVEFTDFQCPSCAAMHPVLEEVLKSYGNTVRLVVRDFPLSQHQHALKAAEAANAAHAQGKFFEYIALLYKRQNALDTPSLKKYASELGLNRQKFDAALDSGIYAAEVKRDIADGEIYGVSSTPSVFVNGVLLKVLSAEALRLEIDRAAAARKAGAPPR